MLRSTAASKGQQASERCEHGRTESEMTIPHGEQSFYLLGQSLEKPGTYAYLRARSVADLEL
jgi:hypothetical protein